MNEHVSKGRLQLLRTLYWVLVLGLVLTLGGYLEAGSEVSKTPGASVDRLTTEDFEAQKESLESKPKGKLYVNTEPSDAQVRIMNIGPRYQRGMELDAGQYDVEVSRAGYRTWRKIIKVTSGEDLKLDVRLEKGAYVPSDFSASSATSSDSDSTAGQSNEGATLREPLNGTIKVGLMAPMTGSWASEGEEMKRVVNLLAENVNSTGGVLGRRIEVINEDDGGDPRTAALAAQRLCNQGIVSVIGTYGSSVTEATMHIYDQSRIIQIANGSTAIRLSQKGLKYFFRTCQRDDEQAKVARKAIVNTGARKVAILHDSTAYGNEIASEAKRLLERSGVKIVFFDALTPGERNYTGILTRIKLAGPDLVFFTGYYPEAGLVLRQKMEMNWHISFLGGDANFNPDLVKIAGVAAAADFRLLGVPLPNDLNNQQAKAFLHQFNRRYGSAPSSTYAVLAGDGFEAIVHAIRQTHSTDPNKLAAYLHEELKSFSGLTGRFSFNERGDRMGELYRIYKVNRQGQFILEP